MLESSIPYLTTEQAHRIRRALSNADVAADRHHRIRRWMLEGELDQILEEDGDRRTDLPSP